MIDEKRVEELYRMAVYDEYEDKKYHQMGEYFKWDYVGKELVKSFFSGTVAFVFLIIFCALGNLDAVMALLNQGLVLNIGAGLIAGYGLFLVVYLLITVGVYHVRYRMGQHRLHKYAVHLKRVRRQLRRKDR